MCNEVVSNEDKGCISLMWVNATKFISCRPKIKSKFRFVIKGFQEKHDLVYKDSSTCKKEGFCVLIIVTATNHWPCKSIEITVAFTLLIGVSLQAHQKRLRFL